MKRIKRKKTIRYCAIAMLCSLTAGVCAHVYSYVHADAKNVDIQVSSLFSFTDGEATTGSISAATNLPSYLTTGELKHTNGAQTFDDFTQKGAYITMERSADVSGNIPTGGANNVVRTSTFDITDNTKDDALFSYIPAPTISRWLESSNGGKTPANQLDLTADGGSATGPTARHFFVKIVDAHDSNNWLRLNFIYRRVSDAQYDYGALSLSAPNGTDEMKIRIQQGGNAGENVVAEHSTASMQQNVVDLQGCVLTQENVWLKYKDLNSIYYDHEEKAIYAEVKAGNQITKTPIRFLDYAGYSDGYTFDFSEVYLEFYYFADQNANCDKNSYIISDLDGMKLQTSEAGILTASEVSQARQKYGVTKLDKEINAVGEEYFLPMVKAHNIFGEKDAEADAKNSRYTVALYNRRGEDLTDTQITGLNNGKWQADAKIKLDLSGRYTLAYTNGAELIRTISLNVLGGKIYADELFTAENVELTRHALAPEYMRDGADAWSECGGEGLGLKWTQAGTLTINREFSADVFTLGQSIVEFRVTPKKPTDDPNTQGTKSTAYEFENIVVSLVDAEDSSVYINFISHATVHGAYYSFTSVAASNQSYANDKKCKKNPDDTFGTYVNTNGVGIESTFTGLPKPATKSYLTTKFYYDNKTKQTAVGPALLENVNDIEGLASRAYMFRDLDNPAHMVGDDKLFTGFPSGRVKIKISVSEALWDDANLVLYSVMGNSVAGDTIEDSLAPEITDVGGFLTVAPKAELNQSFPLPKVSVQDVMDGDITGTAWATLTDPDSITENYNDESFIPTKIGRYVYTVYASDSAGNIAKKSFPIEVYNTLNTMSLSFVDANGARCSYPETACVGERFTIPFATAYGGSGEKEITFNLIAPDGSIVDTSDNVVEFTRQGVYIARYEITDYRGETTSIEYYIVVKRNNVPVLEDVTMPYAFLAGKSYTLPQGKAKDYYSYFGEARNIDTKIEVSENGGAFVALEADRKYTVGENAATVEETGSVSIRYTAYSLSDNTQQASKTYTVPIIKTKYQGDYFVRSLKMGLDYVEVDEGSREAVFSTSTSGESLSFVNVLPAQRLSMTLFSLVGTELNAVDVYITDSLDPTQTVILSIAMVSGKTMFSVNGGESSIVKGSIAAGNSFTFSIKTNNVIYDEENTQICVLTTTANGSPFNGFGSNKVYVKIVAKDVGEAGARFAVRDFCNQRKFLRSAQDRMAPMIIVAQEVSRLHELGSTVTLSRADAIDIMDPSASVCVTVKDPTGAVVNGLSKVPCDVKRSLTLSQYGTYTLIYEATDGAGNSISNQYTLKVLDNVAPSLEIEGSVKTAYTLGETFVLNNARGVDNLTPTADMVVYVSIKEHYTNKVVTYRCDEYGTADKYGATREVVFKSVGTYTIRYYVSDGFSNMAFKTFTVTVTEGGENA